MPERADGRTGLSRPAGSYSDLDLQRKRAQAKTGMTASLGVLAATGIMEALGSRSPTVKTFHIVSGFALIGFSIWHYSLYQRESRSRDRRV